MTTIYIDTSIIMNEGFLRSAYSQAFLKACAILQYKVVIPEIVIDELKGNYPKKLDEKANAFLKAQKELGKLIDLDVARISVPDAVNDYEEWLAELLDEHGVVEAPYPEIPAKELVEMSYEIKKPFKESGEGHKDYIVWQTIKAHIGNQETTPPNIFLTNNTKDFCGLDEDKNPILHNELADQIENEVHRPKVYTSIKSAFDSELSPNLEGILLDDLPDLGAQDIDSMTEKYILEALPNRTLYGLGGVPFSNEISISSIGPHAITDVTLKAVDSEVVIEISGTVDLEVSGCIDKFQYYHADEADQNL